MKRVGILLLVLILLGGLVWWMSQTSSPEGSNLRATDRQFKVENTDQIGRIFLADRNHNITDLTREADRWITADGYVVRPTAMENLLDAVRRIEMRYQPGATATPNVVRDIATNGIKVEIYNRDGNLMRAYYIGGGTADEMGTHAIVVGEEQPYVVHLPGWQGNLRFRYNLKGDDWRDRHLIPLDMGDWKSWEVNYPKQLEKGFKLIEDGQGYRVEPNSTYQQGGTFPYRKGSGEYYLEQVEDIIIEGFNNDYKYRDSIAALVPFCQVKGVTQSGKDMHIDFHPIVINPVMDPKTNTISGSPYVERYYAIREDDFMLVQHRVLQPLLREYNFFFQR